MGFGSPRVSFAALTAFFAIELEASSRGTRASLRFVVNAALIGAPANRHDRLLTTILRDETTCFATSCFCSRTSDGLGDWIRLGAVDRLAMAGLPWSGLPVLESMVRALARDPERLDHVERLIKSLSASEEGRALIPDDLESVWEPIWEARREAAIVKTIGLDLSSVYAGLKDFQRDTVEYVFRRLYADGERDVAIPRCRRGRTWQDARRSRSDRQDDRASRGGRSADRRRLRLFELGDRPPEHSAAQRDGKDDFVLASRITLLPLVLHQLSRNRLNFVSFTPGTSLDLKSTGGIARERALLHRLLARHGDPRPCAASVHDESSRAPSGATRTFAGTSRMWPQLLSTNGCREVRAGNQAPRRAARKRGEPGFREQFDDLRERFRRERKHWPEDRSRRSAEFVGALRDQLARVCVNALEPDLIILDEFQRFKHLLRSDEPAGELAQQLFAFRDHRGESARVVLLSATPYKMLTVSEDVEDDHYKDLVDTLRFLFDDEAETAAFKRDIDAYRDALFHLDPAHLGRALALKGSIEAKLRRVMVRTERLVDHTGSERHVDRAPTRRLDPRDGGVGELRGARWACAHARRRRRPRVLEVGAIPSHVHGRLQARSRRSIVQAKAEPRRFAELVRDQRLLRWDDIERYRKLDPENPRLRSLITEVLDTEAWRLLWIPPSLPYYELGAPFDAERLRGFTKRLIFSAWTVAPKAVAALTSYEAERRMLGKSIKRTTYSEARVKLTPLLRFSSSKGRVYPDCPCSRCSTLALRSRDLAIRSRSAPTRHGCSRRPRP